MSRLVIRAGGWLALGLVSASCKHARGAQPHAHGADPAEGAALYARYCALCHGDDRQGYAADHAPSLRSPELMGSAPDGFLWHAIAYGRPGTAMAAFAEEQGGPLGHHDQHVLYDWLVDQSQVERKPVADRVIVGDPDQGQALYASKCASCHGASGQGGTGTALANPVTLATASDAYLHHTISHGRTGTPMVAFSEQLNPTEIDHLTAFLRSRATGWTTPAPVRVMPPDPTSAILNPTGLPAVLAHRDGRFVSAHSVALALERQERLVLLDARPMSDWQRAHLPGALPMPYYDGVEALVPHLPNDGTPIVAYCACPHAASGRVVDALVAAGFESARILDEGVLHWAGQSYPMAIGDALQETP